MPPSKTRVSSSRNFQSVAAQNSAYISDEIASSWEQTGTKHKDDAVLQAKW